MWQIPPLVCIVLAVAGQHICFVQARLWASHWFYNIKPRDNFKIVVLIDNYLNSYVHIPVSGDFPHPHPHPHQK